MVHLAWSHGGRWGPRACHFTGVGGPPRRRCTAEPVLAFQRMKLRRRDVVRSLAAAIPGAALAAARPVAGRGAVEREVWQVVDAQPTIEGAGVRLRRSLGSRALPLLDPFLMLDEFHSGRSGRLPRRLPQPPPPRVRDGHVHARTARSSTATASGNHGHLGPGSTQWMTAGRGIVHSEMPKQAAGPNGNLLWGFQLWVNLPGARKMGKPRYQDLAPASITEVTVGDAAVRLVAGEANGRRGPVDGIVTTPQMLDVRLPARGSFRHALPAVAQRVRLRVRGNRARRQRARRRRGGAARRPRRRRRVEDPLRGWGANAVPGRPPHRRAGRAPRPVRHEHRRRAPSGRRGLPLRPAGRWMMM